MGLTGSLDLAQSVSPTAPWHRKLQLRLNNLPGVKVAVLRWSEGRLVVFWPHPCTLGWIHLWKGFVMKLVFASGTPRSLLSFVDNLILTLSGQGLSACSPPHSGFSGLCLQSFWSGWIDICRRMGKSDFHETVGTAWSCILRVHASFFTVHAHHERMRTSLRRCKMISSPIICTARSWS
jgi:hypothetical protein